MSASENGWSEYQRLVLADLGRHGKLLNTLNEKINKIHVEIAYLKIKSGIWGLIGGAIPVAVALLFQLIKGG